MILGAPFGRFPLGVTADLNDAVLAVVGKNGEGQNDRLQANNALRHVFVFAWLRRPISGCEVVAAVSGAGQPLQRQHTFHGFLSGRPRRQRDSVPDRHVIQQARSRMARPNDADHDLKLRSSLRMHRHGRRHLIGLTVEAGSPGVGYGQLQVAVSGYRKALGLSNVVRRRDGLDKKHREQHRTQ